VVDAKLLMQRDAMRDHRVPIAVDPHPLPQRPPKAAPPLFPHIQLPHVRHPHVFVPRARLAARGGRRPTIDPVDVGRAAGESSDFDINSINRSMKMNVPVTDHATEFRR
jgi:hypothetical protein